MNDTRYRRKRIRRNRRILAAAALAVAAFGAFLWFLNRPPKELLGDANITYIRDIPVHHDFIDEGAEGRPGEKREILHVVIHETDNFNTGSDAQAHNAFIHLNAQTESLSWHYTVDEVQIYHHLPDDETAYHASDKMTEGGGNKNGIGIEMCVNEDGDYEKTLENTVWLAATLLHEYGLTTADLKTHEDFSGKKCPARLIGEGRWEGFVRRVEQAYAALKTEAEQQDENS